MARSREFDPIEVLDAAAAAFRRDGYAGASIKALESATGIKSGSIYHTFKDKPGLFRAALRHYVDVGFAALIAEHEVPDRGLAGLESLFLAIIEATHCDRAGCLLTNTVVDSSIDHELLAAEITNGLDVLRTVFRTAIEAAVPQALVEVSTTRLLLLYQGICVLMKAGADPSSIRDAVTAEFRLLRAQSG